MCLRYTFRVCFVVNTVLHTSVLPHLMVSCIMETMCFWTCITLSSRAQTHHIRRACVGILFQTVYSIENILYTTDCEECSKTIYCSRLQTLGELHKIFCNQQTKNDEYSSTLHKFFKYNKTRMSKGRFLCGTGEH